MIDANILQTNVLWTSETEHLSLGNFSSEENILDLDLVKARQVYL